MQKLSAIIMAKNEASIISQCLESIKDICDEIILVDTGSTDNTKEIASKYTNKIYDFKFKSDDLEDVDFGAARNESLKHVTSEWILMIDCDEVIPEEAKPMLRQLLALNNSKNVYNVNIKNLIDNNDPVMHCNFRLFPNKPDLKFVNPIHEALTIDKTKYNLISAGDFYILHYGYLQAQKKRKNTDERNLKILLKLAKNNPESGHFYYYIGQQYFLFNQLELSLENYEKALKMLTAKPTVETTIFTPLIYSGISKCYIAMDNLPKALELSMLDITNPDIYIDLGTFFFNKNKFYDSMRMYEKAITLRYSKNLCSAYDQGSITWKAYAGLGNVYTSINHAIKAIDNFRLAKMYKSDNPQIINALYSLAFQLGDLDEAEDELDNLIQLCPNVAKYRIEKGNIHANRNQIDEALKIFFEYCDIEELLAIADRFKNVKRFDCSNKIEEFITNKKLIKLCPHRSGKNGPQFTIIIPTLLKAPKEVFEYSLEQYNNNPLVKTIIIIDNTKDKQYKNTIKVFSKVKLIEDNEDYFVNKAWNKGMEYCDTPYFILANDDILCHTSVINDCYNVLEENNKCGIIQISTTNVDLNTYTNFMKMFDKRVNDPTKYYVTEKFSMMGWFIIGRKENYITIPDELKIFFGDNILYINSQYKGYNVCRIISKHISHLTSTTVNSLSIYQRGTLDEENKIFQGIWPKMFPDFKG